MGDAWIINNNNGFNRFCGQNAGGVRYDIFSFIQQAIQNVSLRVKKRNDGRLLGR